MRRPPRQSRDNPRRRRERLVFPLVSPHRPLLGIPVTPPLPETIMRFRPFARPIRSLLVGCLLLPAMVLFMAPASAANAIVKDGNTIQLADITYRLDGIDAPGLDQICIHEQAAPWSCGGGARD